MSETVRILAVQHEDDAGPMRFGQWLSDAGAEVLVVRPDRGETLPEPSDFTEVADALMVLGGEAGALDDADNPWFPAVRELLTASAEGEFPSFNICLGGQMLAVAGGGGIRTRERGQFGALLVEPLPEAAADPVFSSLVRPCRSVLFHGDEILPPAGAVQLVTGTDAPVQAYRLGEMAWGTQFHPECTGEQIAGWFAGMSEPPAGVDAGAVAAQVTAAEAEIAEAMAPLAAAFVGFVRKWQESAEAV